MASGQVANLPFPQGFCSATLQGGTCRAKARRYVLCHPRLRDCVPQRRPMAWEELSFVIAPNAF